VTIEADRKLVVIESRSIADVARGSSGASRVIPLDQVTTVRWTYRRPDGESAELGRVQLVLIDDRVVTIGWQHPTAVAYELASMIASLADAPLRCDEHGDGLDGDTDVCRL
jgi:hypothetical protein